MLGKPVAAELARSGFNVRALVRNGAKLVPESVHPWPGNLNDEQTLHPFLDGQEAVYINLSVKPNEARSDFHTETDGLAKLIRAAKKSQIRRIAFVSSLVMHYQGMHGFSWWVFEVKKRALEQIKSSGIPYTIFYPSTFMENFEGNFRRGNRIVLAGKSEYKMYFISAADFARQVARSFELGGTGNYEWTVQGPEGLTIDEAADIYVKNYAKSRLKISRAPLGLLKFLGKVNRTMDYGGHIVEALNRYPEKFDAEKTWEVLGKPVITLAQHAQSVGR